MRIGDFDYCMYRSGWFDATIHSNGWVDSSLFPAFKIPCQPPVPAGWNLGFTSVAIAGPVTSIVVTPTATTTVGSVRVVNVSGANSSQMQVTDLDGASYIPSTIGGTTARYVSSALIARIGGGNSVTLLPIGGLTQFTNISVSVQDFGPV